MPSSAVTATRPGRVDGTVPLPRLGEGTAPLPGLVDRTVPMSPRTARLPLRRPARTLAACVWTALALAPAALRAQEVQVDTTTGRAAGARPAARMIFYRALTYGSDAYMGPLDVILNKGYAVAQFNNRNRHIFEYDYGTRHVWSSVAHPVENVRRYGGWEKLIREELLPLSLSWRKWKWAPNYVGHVLEGGITYRRLAEWHEAHGVPLPALSAAVVTMGAAVINEMYAHPGYVEGTTATMTDLLFFDPLGILLFAHDGVARIFAERLRGTIWSSQAALTLDGELVNNGNNVILKLPLSPFPSTSIFVRAGLAFTPGVTFHRDSGLDVSVAFGAEGRIQGVDPETGEETPELALGAGLFLDRNGSLLMSVTASEVEHRRLVVNVYPGVIPFAGGRFGAWFLLRDDGAVRFGLSARGALGLGLAAGIGG
jgi:hypothetical protein